jgi:uncharacterized protein (TIGR03435 family)
MTRRQLLLLIAGITAAIGVASAQEFEVASIRPTQGGPERVETSPGNLTMRSVRLQACIRWAYGVHDYQISGGPNWLNSERYDVIAKPASAATEDQLRMMLRALLADRFKLALHPQSKELSVYVLAIGKNGSKLKASKDSTAPRNVLPAAGGITLQNVTMSEFTAEFLSRVPALDRPVLDRTGLQGKFDITLMLFDNQPGADPAAVKRAVGAADVSNYVFAVEQLGLKLETQKLPIDILMIDRAEKPNEN